MSPEHDLTKQLTEKGWITFESSSPEATAFTVSALGPVIQKTHVQPRLNARAALATDLEMELARVKRELADVKMERDILKKAAAYFAKESLQGTR